MKTGGVALSREHESEIVLAAAGNPAGGGIPVIPVVLSPQSARSPVSGWSGQRERAAPPAHRWASLAAVALAAAMSAAVATGCGAPTDESVASDSRPAAESETSSGDVGEETYATYCAVCHGLDGQPVPDMLTAPVISGQDLLALASDEYLAGSIRLGRPGANGRRKPGTKMSAFGKDQGGPLDESRITALVDHMRAWQTSPSIALDPDYVASGDARSGESIYTRDCAACHGDDGWGEAAPRLAGATFQAVASDDFIRQSILRGRTGTRMPGFTYSEDEMHDLITFVRRLGSIGDADTPAPAGQGDK